MMRIFKVLAGTIVVVALLLALSTVVVRTGIITEKSTTTYYRSKVTMDGITTEYDADHNIIAQYPAE